MAALQALLDLVTDFNYSIDREGKYFSDALHVCALHFCFATYYVFSISFPVDFRFVLLVLEKYNICLWFKIISKPLSFTAFAYSLNKALSLEI